MRPDHQKLKATRKEGAKAERKDLENRRQPQSLSKQGHEQHESGQGHVRRRDGSGDDKGGPRSNG